MYNAPMQTSEKEPRNSKEKDKNDDRKTGRETLPRIHDVRRKVPIGPGNFWNNILSGILLLVLLTAAYSYMSDREEEPQ